MTTRRQFLALAAASGSAPHCWTLMPARDGARLERALERAHGANKPLLVLPVESENAREHTDRAGRLFGALLQRASDAELAALALAEFACIPRAALEAHGALPAATLFAVLAGDPARVTATFGSAALAVASDPSAQVPILAAWLRAALAPDEARARAAAAALHGGRGGGGSELHLDQPELRPRLAVVDRAAAGLWPYATSAEDPAAALWLARLAAAAAARLWDAEPDGARWIVDPLPVERPDPCPACGMGFIPVTSRTFLDAYTRER